MIDINELAKEIGFTFDRNGYWLLEDKELQLFAEKVMQAERERSRELINAAIVLEMLAKQPLWHDDPLRVKLRAAIAKYEKSK